MNGVALAVVVVGILAACGTAFSVGLEMGASSVQRRHDAVVARTNEQIDALGEDLRTARAAQTIRTEIVKEFVPVEIKTVQRVKTPCDLDTETIRKLNTIR